MPTAVQRLQFFSAVAQLADLTVLQAAVSADVNDPIWIEYNSANCVVFNDALSQFTAQVYGWDDEEMVNLFKVAQMTPTACTGTSP